MPSSPIRKLAAYAEAAKRNGTKVYHLNIGQPDIKTPQCGLDALKSIDRDILEYSPSQVISLCVPNSSIITRNSVSICRPMRLL